MKKFYVFPPRPDDIMHFGIKRKSGRYPWGSGKRPYQSLGSKGASSSMTPEQQQAEKERILKAGSASEVLTLQGQVTNEELQRAVTRINLETQLKTISQAEFKSTMDKIDDVMKGVKKGTEWVKIGTDMYNAMANIYNATDEGQKEPLTLVGKGDKKDKK